MGMRTTWNAWRVGSGRGVLAASIAGWLAGCSGGGAPGADAVEDGGPDADETFEAYHPPAPEPPEDPAAPAPPVLEPCPAGWRRLAPDIPGDPALCDPWPVGGAGSCGAGEAHFPGESGCLPVGGACPAGEWAADLPADQPVVHVRAGAGAGGDGSVERPFGSIAEALAAVETGGVVALARGTYAETLTLGRRVTLWGACAAETAISCGAAGTAEATVRVTGTGVVLRNLRIGGPCIGVMVGRTGRAELQGVEIAEAAVFGLALVDGGRLTGREVVIRDTGPRADDGMFGRGIEAEHGAQIELTRLVLERNRDVGLLAFDPDTLVRLSDAAIRETGPGRGSRGGQGIQVQAGARVEVERGALEGNREFGVLAGGSGTTVVLRGAVVRDTRPRSSAGAGGRGLQADEGATVELYGVLVERNRESGVMARLAGSTLRLNDVVVRDTLPLASDGSGGRGVTVQEGASAEFDRVLLDRNRNVACYVAGAGSMLRVNDLRARETAPQEDDEGTTGRGLVVGDGAAVEGARVALEHNRDVGLLAVGNGTWVVLADLEVNDTDSGPGGTTGRGLQAQDGARLVLERVRSIRNHEAAIMATGPGTVIDLRDARASDTRSEVLQRATGRGLQVQSGAVVTGTRLRIEGNREFGAVVFGDGARLELSDAAIVGTLERECAIDTCPDLRGGSGLLAAGGGDAVLTRFALRGNALCGVQLAVADGSSGGTAALHEGEVSENVVGANVQVDEFDVSALMDRVVYRDNERNLDLTALPVPGAAVAVGEP